MAVSTQVSHDNNTPYEVRFLPCGDTAFSVQFGETISRELCLQVLKLKQALTQANIAGVIESVPSYRALLIHYDPLTIRQQKLIEAVKNLLDTPGEVILKPRKWQLPVCFDEEFAWDLEEISTTLKQSRQQVLDVFTGTELFVYMVGFTLGYLYLGDLPVEYRVLSRRNNPRTKLNVGAVATAQGMAVVHSIASPGGWNVIGKTPAPLFDIRNLPPSPFRPGDSICFTPISTAQLLKIEQQVATNSYQLDAVEVKI